MKFSELKKTFNNEFKTQLSKNIYVSQENNSVNLPQKEEVSDIPTLNIKKEIEIDSKSIGVDNLSNKNDKYKSISFDEMEFEKIRGVYSILLKRYSSAISKVYDASYLTVGDDIKYLSSFIYENLSSLYLPLMLVYLTAGNYVISHSINTAILSGMIARTLNIDSFDVIKIIISSLCIDIAMSSYKNLYSQERVLNYNEKKIIEMHISDGVEIVEKIFAFESNLKEFVSKIVLNSHERFDGSGYYGKKAEELDLFSQIVAISDFYEAITHPRTWRGAFEEGYAIELITSKYRKLFAPQAVKGLISAIGMYPPGSLVKLSTGEIAKVIFVNKDKLFRPFVKVLMNSSFIEINYYYLDLLEYPLTSIESYVRYSDLEKWNLQFKTQFDIDKLWIEW